MMDEKRDESMFQGLVNARVQSPATSGVIMTRREYLGTAPARVLPQKCGRTSEATGDAGPR